MDQDFETERDERPYSTNLLTLREKQLSDIAEAKERVDANEK